MILCKLARTTTNVSSIGFLEEKDPVGFKFKCLTYLAISEISEGIREISSPPQPFVLFCLFVFLSSATFSLTVHESQSETVQSCKKFLKVFSHLMFIVM